MYQWPYMLQWVNGIDVIRILDCVPEGSIDNCRLESIHEDTSAGHGVVQRNGGVCHFKTRSYMDS